MQGKNNKVEIFKIILLWSFLTCTFFYAKGSTNITDNQAGILVISSYSPTKEEGNRLIASFTQQIKQLTDERVYVEYMNCEASTDFLVWSSWMKQMFHAYTVKPAVIVLLGGEAWATYRETCENNWKDIPIILGSMKKGYVDYKNLFNGDFNDIKQVRPIQETFGTFNITGYFTPDLLLENIDLIRKLQPQVKHIAFCFDNLYALPFLDSYIKQLSEEYGESLDLFCLSGAELTTTQLIDTIMHMDDSYALLTATWFTDAARYPHSYSMLHNELSRHTNKFMYQISDFGWNNMNYLGGYYISGKKAGQDIAMLTHQVLTNGIEKAPAFSQLPSLPQYYINYPTLKEVGIDSKKLPDRDVFFYNKKASFLEEYPKEIAAIMITIILLIGLWQRERKHKKVLDHNLILMKKQKRKFEENKQMLEFTMSATNNTPWEYHIPTDTLHIAESFTTLFSSQKESIRIEEFNRFVHPEDVNLLSNGLADLISQKSKLITFQIRTKATGSEKYSWFEMQAVVYRYDKSGKPEKIIGLKHNITNLKRTEELILLRDKAEEANRLKTAFLANMSHEIRTPLNAIVGFSTLLTDSDDKKEKKEFSKIIQVNNDILLQLVNDILDISKIEAGEMINKYTTVNLNELFKNLERTYSHQMKTGVKLISALPSRPVSISTEKNRITQVMTNFLSNARKYTQKGSITMGYELQEQQLRFFVTDTGIGISKENIPHVFERFAKFNSFVQGAGLGLSICELIIQKLGGEIGVESEENKGSTFWFTLPFENSPTVIPQ